MIIWTDVARILTLLFRFKEWCELSIRMNQRADDSRKENFAIVASSKSGARYCRDLPALLKLSMDGKEYELALELSKSQLVICFVGKSNTNI
jgi:hypothetical protein